MIMDYLEQASQEELKEACKRLHLVTMSKFKVILG